jgi:hypothetical protein
MSDFRKVAAAGFVLVVMSLLWMGCGSGGGYKSKRESSVASGGADYFADGSAGNAAMDMGYESQYARETQSLPPESAPEEPGAAGPDSAEGLIGRDRAMDFDQRIESWFSPAAYAADSGVDIKYLIRTGTIVTRVEDFDAAQGEVNAVAAKYGGLVTDSQITNIGDNQRQGSLTLRIPNTRFIEAFNELRKLGETDSENVGSQDVSHEYVSAVSQLKNLNAEQETLRQMLAEALAVQRSRGLGDAYTMLLDTQKRLSEVSGQIQSTEGRIGQLADQITRSTITVTLIQRDRVESGEFSWGLGATFDKAKHDVVLGLRNFLNGLLYLAVAGWMWVWPWALIGYIAWRVWRKYRKQESRQSPVAS